MTDICPNCDELGCEETYFSYKYLCPNDECWVHTSDGKLVEQLRDPPKCGVCGETVDGIKTVPLPSGGEGNICPSCESELVTDNE